MFLGSEKAYLVFVSMGSGVGTYVVAAKAVMQEKDGSRRRGRKGIGDARKRRERRDAKNVNKQSSDQFPALRQTSILVRRIL